MSEQDLILKYVEAHGVARARDLAAEGFHSQILTRMVAQGQLQRLSRGLYASAQHELSPWHDLAEIAKTVPAAVVNLVSALAYHEIGTQLPYVTWIALPAGSWSPQKHGRLRVTHLSEPYYSAGIEVHEIEGVRVKIYSVAKTVTDCFRMRSKVGYEVTLEALKDAWTGNRVTMDDITRYAKLNHVEHVMRPYLETIAS